MKYLENFDVVYWPTGRGTYANQSGYGNKIPTTRMVILRDDKKKIKRRVYAICWSNVASFYIIKDGERIFIRDSDLQIGDEDE